MGDTPSEEKVTWGRCLGLANLIFAVGLATGMISAASGALPSTLCPDAETTTRQLRHRLRNPPLETATEIFTNNVKVYAIYMGGIFLLGLPSALYLLWFGFQTGAILIGGPLSGGTPPSLVLAYFLPHGVIEIPAFLLAASLGFRTFFGFIRYLRHRGPILTPEDRRPLILGAGLALALVALGAVVEATLTARCIEAALARSGS